MNIYQDVYQEAFKDELEKIAKYKPVGAIEDYLGTFLSDKDEEIVRGAASEAKEKSFILQHPILTGIPTLGIAPYLKRYETMLSTIKSMSSKNPDIKKLYEKKQSDDRLSQANPSIKVSLT